jgi:hypothetical protein
MSRSVALRRERSFQVVDGMTRGLRECVHEFGLPIVDACLAQGVRDPAAIRELVRAVWEGARHTGQRRPPLGSLDWLLVQAGANISAATLDRVLRDNSYCIAPMNPTAAMINASMRVCSTFSERVTKHEKHRRRLHAALAAVSRETSEPQ